MLSVLEFQHTEMDKLKFGHSVPERVIRGFSSLLPVDLHNSHDDPVFYLFCFLNSFKFDA